MRMLIAEARRRTGSDVGPTEILPGILWNYSVHFVAGVGERTQEIDKWWRARYVRIRRS